MEEEVFHTLPTQYRKRVQAIISEVSSFFNRDLQFIEHAPQSGSCALNSAGRATPKEKKARSRGDASPRLSTVRGKDVLQRVFEHWCTNSAPRQAKKQSDRQGKRRDPAQASKMPEWAFLKLCRVARLITDDLLLADLSRIFHIACNTVKDEKVIPKTLSYDAFRIAMQLVGDALENDGEIRDPVGEVAGACDESNGLPTTVLHQ